MKKYKIIPNEDSIYEWFVYYNNKIVADIYHFKKFWELRFIDKTLFKNYTKLKTYERTFITKSELSECLDNIFNNLTVILKINSINKEFPLDLIESFATMVRYDKSIPKGHAERTHSEKLKSTNNWKKVNKIIEKYGLSQRDVLPILGNIDYEDIIKYGKI